MFGRPNSLRPGTVESSLAHPNFIVLLRSYYGHHNETLKSRLVCEVTLRLYISHY